jgi:monoamine oxidase
MTVYAQGGAAGALVAMDHHAQVAHGIDVLDRMFPGIASKKAEVVVHSWVDDVWARGAQALIEDMAVRAELGRPEGRIHFSGDFKGTHGHDSG